MTSSTKAKAKDDEPETVEVVWAYNPNLDLIGTKADLDIDEARVLLSEGRIRLSGRSEGHRLAGLHAGLATTSLDAANVSNTPSADTSSA